MDNAVTRVLAPGFGPLAVAVSLVQLLGQELEELVGILLLGGNKVLKRLLLTYPKAGEDTGCCVAVSVLQSIELLKHVVHCTAEAVGLLAVGARMAITEVEVPENGVVKEALQDDILVASGAGVVDASQAVGLAGGGGRIGRNVLGILLDGVREHLLVLAFASWSS